VIRDRVGVEALAWPACAVGLVALAALLSATAASAQTNPVAEPPSELSPSNPDDEPADTEPTDTEAQSNEGGSVGLGAPARWNYGVGAGVGYDGNIGFRVPDGPSSWAVSPWGALARVFTGPRGEFRLAGAGSWQGYPQLSQFNHYNLSAGLGGRHRFSPVTSWSGDASYHLGYSDQSVVLSEQGVLLPLVRTRTAVARLGMTRRLGRRTSFRLGGSFSRVDFDQQDIGARLYSNGQTLRGDAQLRRRFGRRDSLALAYSLSSTLSRQTVGTDQRSYYLTHSAALRWGHVLNPRNAFLLEGGASYTPEVQASGLPGKMSFHGGGAYNLRARRSRLTLFARRYVTPAFGLGVSRVQTTMGLSGSILMGRSWSFHVAFRHTIPATPQGIAVSYGTVDDALAALSRGFGRLWAVSAEGRYRRRGPRGLFPEIQSYQVGLYLSYGGQLHSGHGRLGRL
jgi:hypothetical protein